MRKLLLVLNVWMALTALFCFVVGTLMLLTVMMHGTLFPDASFPQAFSFIAMAFSASCLWVAIENLLDRYPL